jgi:hypothetical protein
MISLEIHCPSHRELKKEEEERGRGANNHPPKKVQFTKTRVRSSPIKRKEWYFVQ